MKFDQLIEYIKRNISFKNDAENEAGETKSGKSKWSASYFQYISIVLNLTFEKNKLYKTLDY